MIFMEKYTMKENSAKNMKIGAGALLLTSDYMKAVFGK